MHPTLRSPSESQLNPATGTRVDDALLIVASGTAFSQMSRPWLVQVRRPLSAVSRSRILCFLYWFTSRGVLVLTLPPPPPTVADAFTRMRVHMCVHLYVCVQHPARRTWGTRVCWKFSHKHLGRLQGTRIRYPCVVIALTPAHREAAPDRLAAASGSQGEQYMARAMGNLCCKLVGTAWASKFGWILTPAVLRLAHKGMPRDGWKVSCTFS